MTNVQGGSVAVSIYDAAARMSEGCPPSDAAISYAKQGIAIFPLRPAGKRPLVAGGFHAASADPDQVRCWWRRYPNANIGLRTGYGLVVVDIDPRSGGVRDPLWPKTLTATTRSGGQHLYYGCAIEIRNSAGQVAVGVDIRGDGGSVVAPPSPGWSWSGLRSVVELPTSLLLAATAPASLPGTPRFRQQTAFKPCARVSEGGRNDYLARAAGWALRMGFDPDELPDVLVAHNTAVCVPPLPDREVRAIAASIIRCEERRAQ